MQDVYVIAAGQTVFIDTVEIDEAVVGTLGADQCVADN